MDIYRAFKALNASSENSKADKKFKDSLKTRVDLAGKKNSWVTNFSIKRLLLLSLIMLFAVPGLYLGFINENKPQVRVNSDGLIDDWQFEPTGEYDGVISNVSRGIFPGGPNSATVYSGSVMEDSLGFTVGGANDINSFRQNIEEGYTPIPTDMTFEGLFSDYYFDTGSFEPCDKLFCPSYATAVAADPYSDKDEYYMSVGFNSGMKESDFARRNLNLVIVLDISGSMSSPFNSYYYDKDGNYIEDQSEPLKTKMEVANESIANIVDLLEPGDELGIVLFDGESYVAKPINLIEITDKEAIKEHILDIAPQGSTNMEAGYKNAVEMISERIDSDEENRIIFLTDAMPNTGQIGSESLLGMVKEQADTNVYTSVIGIGVDFNTELVEEMLDVRGANYFSVNSADEFKKVLNDQFDYLVSPLIFDLELKLNSNDYEIIKVYVSPDADKSTGSLVNITTLFPSDSSGGEVKGGVVLLKLAKVGDSDDNDEIELVVSYSDRDGNSSTVREDAQFRNTNEEYFDNNGIRKAIALTRYAEVMQSWSYEIHHPMYTADDYAINGISVNEDFMLGEWERKSMTLRVESYGARFDLLKSYLETEISAIGDDSMKQEIELINLILQNDGR